MDIPSSRQVFLLVFACQLVTGERGCSAKCEQSQKQRSSPVQILYCRGSPGHGRPTGFLVMQVRVRTEAPPPQLREHTDHSPQDPHSFRPRPGPDQEICWDEVGLSNRKEVNTTEVRSKVVPLREDNILCPAEVFMEL